MGKCQVVVFVLSLRPGYVHLCLQGSYVCPCCCMGLVIWSDLQLTQYVFILNFKAEAFLSVIIAVGRGFEAGSSMSTGWPPPYHPLASASSGEIRSQACATTAQPCLFCMSTFLCGYTRVQVDVCMYVHICVHVSLVPLFVFKQTQVGDLRASLVIESKERYRPRTRDQVLTQRRFFCPRGTEGRE